MFNQMYTIHSKVICLSLPTIYNYIFAKIIHLESVQHKNRNAGGTNKYYTNSP